MEPPLKRRRLSNPDAGLSERRARNDFRLKSIFESIFEKYGRDFDGIGDEIDMNTGEIVVNNGHILSMRNERDAGDIQSLDDELESIYSSGDDQETVELHDQGQEFLADPSEVQNTVLASALESVDLIENGDNVIGDVDELETPEMEPVRITRRILATQDLEEDELASNEFDWLSPRKLRSIAQDRWRLHELETVEREATEPVWRAPPLPDRKPLHRQIPKHSDVLFEHTQNHPDSEDLGISIWALGENLGYDLSDSSKQHNLSGDHLGQSVSSTGASLHTVEVDTATRRNWCIERFRQVGISATSPKIAFHANESTGYNVKDELPQTTTIDLSSSRASSETKASRNHVIEMTTVPDTLQTPESGLATSQDARSIPILAEDQDHDQSLATTLSDPQHTFLQSELEPIYVPSTQICPGVKVVIPLAARINVPEEVSAVLEVKASQDSLEDLCDKIEVESSIRETVDQYFCADGESTMNMRLPIPVQPDPGGSSATVFDSSTESEDELAKPVVHSRITYSARQPHKNSSAVLEVPDSQPTPDIQPKRIMYFSTTGKFSDRLPLRGPRSQNKRNLKTVKTEIADSFDSMSTAADDDCSEDELA
ncbi:hypothetical protein P7C71_g4352, partial [Lecanoromycetidae sp. Uapishka_2]